MRRGAALAAVLLALALANALVISAVYVARRQSAAAGIAGAGAPLQPAAEWAIVSAIAAWDSLARSEQPVGATVTQLADSAGNTVWITRVSHDVYWLVGESRLSSAPGSSRRVGAVVRSAEGAARVVYPRGWAELP